jgi:hypothetical protein
MATAMNATAAATGSPNSDLELLVSEGEFWTGLSLKRRSS